MRGWRPDRLTVALFITTMTGLVLGFMLGYHAEKPRGEAPKKLERAPVTTAGVDVTATGVVITVAYTFDGAWLDDWANSRDGEDVILRVLRANRGGASR